jgi:uncharacterized membrane protein YphA (DoxX/SURF4 family)
MSYLSQAVLLVFVLACVMMVEAFWSSWHSEKDLPHSYFKSIVTGIGFVIYAGIDYLMIIPSGNYVIP